MKIFRLQFDWTRFLVPLVCTLSILLGVSDQTRAQDTAVVILSGHELSLSMPSNATGTATFIQQNDSLMVSGSFEDLSSPYRGGGIFYGRDKNQGNQIFELNVDLHSSELKGRIKRSKNTFVLTDALLQALKNNLIYIKIYTDQNSHGELYGRIKKIN